MKKNLIALAVSAAFVVPAMSQAETTVYGIAQVELGNVSPDKPTGTTAAANSYLETIDNANGRVGVKSSEDLGNGWTGLAKFEFKADTADGGATDSLKDSTGATIKGSSVALTARETMVGLKGKGVGQFEFGRLKQPYKYSGGVTYDPFVATTLEARGNGGMTQGEYGQGGFSSNTIAYHGMFGPVKAWVMYGPETNDGYYNLSVTYSQDMFQVGVAALDTGDRTAGLAGEVGKGVDVGTVDSYSATKIYGKYNMGMHTIVAQYEMTDHANCSGDGCKPNDLFLGYHLTMGNNMFVAEYGSLDMDGLKVGTKKLDTTMFVLGVVHKMSKTTRIFGGYRSTTNDANVRFGVAGDTTYLPGGTATAPQGTENVISVGLRKDFK